MRCIDRWGIFNLVGVLGAAVQLAALGLFLEYCGIDYRVATVLAVEAAILHNFAWHEQWTWADRKAGAGERLRRLLRFHLANGGISLMGNLIVMQVLVGTLGIRYVAANFAAILACSILNYFVGDRFVFSNSSLP